jgi:PadR family transcriptional regulator PadR
MRAEVLKGHLDALLLAVVADGPVHGYRIVEELRRRSRGAFDLPEGTVYPALHRLEGDGLLTSRWTTSTGRRRRVYRITGRGRSALARERAEWDRFARAVREVLV